MGNIFRKRSPWTFEETDEYIAIEYDDKVLFKIDADGIMYAPVFQSTNSGSNNKLK